MSEPPVLNLPLLGRRSVLRLLGVAALGLVASCRPGKQRSAPTSSAASTAAAAGSSRPAAPASPAPAGASPQPTVSALSAEQLVAQRVAAAEQELLAAYDAVTVAHPELVDRLAPFRADHVAHLHGLEPGATPSTAAPNPPPSTAPFEQRTPSNAALRVARHRACCRPAPPPRAPHQRARPRPRRSCASSPISNVRQRKQGSTTS